MVEFIHIRRLRDRRFCWCDLAAQAQFERGFFLPFYVIEITVAPWVAEDERNAALIQVTAASLPTTHTIWATKVDRAFSLFTRVLLSTWVPKSTQFLA